MSAENFEKSAKMAQKLAGGRGGGFPNLYSIIPFLGLGSQKTRKNEIGTWCIIILR